MSLGATAMNIVPGRWRGCRWHPPTVFYLSIIIFLICTLDFPEIPSASIRQK